MLASPSRLGLLVGAGFFALIIVALVVGYRVAPNALTPAGGSNQHYQGTALGGEPAPDFRLVDQHQQTVALSDLRGKVVVLAFVDPLCTDVCPLTTLHFRQTSEALGPDRERVAFLAVNANPSFSSVADVAAATEKWGMGPVPQWYYLTGSPGELEAVWKSYHVASGFLKTGKPPEVEHTSGVFLIDQAGRERWYISLPLDSSGNEWSGPPLSVLLLQGLRSLLEAR